MTGNEAALDTNQAIAILNAREGASEWLATLDEVYLPVPVLGELRFGALKSARSVANIERIDRFLSHCVLLPVTETTADYYARIRAKLSSLGTPIPENDVWIAACCLEHEIPLTTADAHFERVEDLATIIRGS